MDTTTASMSEARKVEDGASWTVSELERMRQEAEARRVAADEREARAMDAILGGRWQDAAECEGDDPRLFDADAAEYDPAEAAKSCAVCPVRDLCREWVDQPAQRYFRGVAGGVQIVDERPGVSTRAVRVARPLVAEPLVLVLDERKAA